MATPSEKLAESLSKLKNLQNEKGIAVIKSDDLSRTHKERLLENGFIQEVIKGWYIAVNPDDHKGDTTSWFASFWDFVSKYITSKFGSEWSLSPEQSLLLHSGNFAVPKQLLIRSPKASSNLIELINDTSVFDSRVDIPPAGERVILDGINLYSLPLALVAVKNDFFMRNRTDALICLGMIKNASDILRILLEEGKSVVAGRLAGAFRNIGRDKIADEIIQTMKKAGYDARESDPFEVSDISIPQLQASPSMNRIILMWSEMRERILKYFPEIKAPSVDIENYLHQTEENFTSDAYHSLSIEGYRVSPELIEQVKKGDWNPEEREKDKEQRDALAARGYYLAFERVKESIIKILKGENSGNVVNTDLHSWYRELFAPSVQAGILKPSDLAGYRNGAVFIKGSNHVPPRAEAVRDAMPTFMDLLAEEKDARVRIILGHFIFVYIHPYYDGNGRIGRFIMNTMMASAGLPWLIIPVEKRRKYMSALEKASVNRDISDFTKFIVSLID
jgi:Fic family protein